MLTVAPTSTNSQISAATQSFENLPDIRFATGALVFKRVTPIPITASNPENSALSPRVFSNATSAKDAPSSRSTLIVSRICTRLKRAAGRQGAVHGSALAGHQRRPEPGHRHHPPCAGSPAARHRGQRR
uniref:Uncharacterized protein n=1 Tax=Escherichia coli TaxID=562 RepID=B1VCH5_ECOLX|nr:unnamed protein product [Escherichia coli]